MKNKLNFTIIILLYFFSTTVNAQNRYGGEINIGPTMGDSKDYYSFSAQAHFFYLAEVTNSFYLGPTTGVILFAGDGDSEEEIFFGDIPDVYIPLAIAGRVKLSKGFSLGIDTGYGINATGGEGGFYYRPLIAVNISKKASLTASYTKIDDEGDKATSINFGLIFGF